MKLSEATILLVDDEPMLRMIFERWITAVGCGKVYTAGDGKAALALLESTHVDLLVSDIRMPVMDGVTLVRRLAEMDRPISSIIFVSGFGDIDLREMYALGVEAFLAKPSLREDLLEVMQRAIAERSELWLTPMAVAPRQTMLLEARGVGLTAGDDSIRLGRGGFSAHHSGAASLGKVAFSCHFAQDDRVLSGQGYVRWNSRADQMVGIEFAYLDAPCRSWLMEELAVESPRSFIPSSLGDAP